MSDIANPRTENYYLHPKKYAWRSDNRPSTLEQHTSKEQDIAPSTKDRFKMVINSSLKMEFNPPNEILNEDQRSRSPSQTTEEKPLDFSVKPLYSDRIRGSELRRTLSEFPVKDNRISENGEFISIYQNDKRAPAVPIYNGKTSSTVINGNSKFKRPKQSPLSDSLPSSHSDTGSQSSHLYPEDRLVSQSPQHVNNIHESQTLQYMNDIHESKTPKHVNSMHESQSPERVNNMNGSFSRHMNTINERFRQHQLVNFTDYRHKLNEDVSFDGDKQSSPKSPRSLSRETSPDNKQSFAGSILHEVLVGSSAEKSQNHGMNSGSPNFNSASTSKSMQGSVSPQLFSPHAVPAAGLSMPSTSSVKPPRGALIPGSLPGVAFFNSLGFSSAALNGMNPFSNGSLLVSPLPQNPSTGDKKQTKPVRPFKAMTNELLYGVPAMGLSAMTPFISSNGYYNNYFQGSTNVSTIPPKDRPVPKKESPETSVNSAMSSSPPCSTSGTQPKPDDNGSGDSNISYPDATSSVMDTADANSNRKKGRSLPEEMKDDAYWERRRKNNQAAKRSRDARRQKEDMVAHQAWVFRETNVQLQYQITVLEEQNHHSQIQYRALVEQYRNVELQLQLMKDKLSRKRCGKCGSRIEHTENSFCESNKSDSFEA